MINRLSLAASLCLGALPALPTKPAQAASERVVYAMSTAPSECQLPGSKLLHLANKLYGTCPFGGGADAHGVVFELTLDGQFQVVHTFVGGADGAAPGGNLVELNGLIYGVTSGGGIPGQSGFGTVYVITPSSGAYAQVHVFSQAEAAYPSGGLLAVNGVLFGATVGGGAGFGTIYSLTPDNQLSTIYSFHGADGFSPTGALANIGGTLFGVTLYGGKGYMPSGNGSKRGKPGHGLVFSVTTTGTETVLHEFHSNSSDGTEPTGNLLALGNSLYGTTYAGGANAAGTVYEVGMAGAGYKRVYDFSHTAKSTFPFANGGLIALRGVVYGTTQGSGAYGNGTVFSVTHAGVESTIWSFKGGRDGETPSSGLTAVQGMLYGVTDSGGGTGVNCLSEGCGAVFEVTP